MRLLVDTHVVISLLNDDLNRSFPIAARLLSSGVYACHVSVASIWEIAIKTKIGKLDCPVPTQQLSSFLIESGFNVLPISAVHASADIHPDVPTRDPFDRLLIATAQAEDLRLLTADRMLADHPVSFR